MSRLQVVITGVGVVSPLGRGVEKTWAAVLDGKGGMQRRDDRRIVARVDEEFFESPFRDGEGRPVAGRAAQLAVMAGSDALASAGLSSSRPSGRPVDLVVGTTMGEPTWIDTWSKKEAARSPPPPDRARELLAGTPAALTAAIASGLEVAFVDAADVSQGTGTWPVLQNHPQSSLATRSGTARGGPIGRSASVGGACAAGNFALARAVDDIRAGHSTIVLAGGVDAFSDTALMGFAKLGALAEECCRPFGKDRQGLVLGEGAAFLLVEELGHARARGAEVFATLAGAGLSCDAHHPTSPRPDGSGAAQALASALEDAEVDPDEVGWVSAHGTGTLANDRTEILALRRVFGDQSKRRPPASSVKSLTGHGLGAASAIEAVLCVLALQEGIVPPTWHVGDQDPDCDWDVVTEGRRETDLEAVVNQAYAFGGCNGVTVFRAAQRDASGSPASSQRGLK